ncbi:unnamed protein product [Angiostrongylus costaricensis]|uniref:Hydrolase_4 domain-containing protein n=1 Tax=Angiostrongylus costaricensis TaxID=334426 RepID=A0A0R3P9U3_ANGCS|nr:unnamed protein product [Angiostrongylus costaricensis]
MLVKHSTGNVDVTTSRKLKQQQGNKFWYRYNFDQAESHHKRSIDDYNPKPKIYARPGGKLLKRVENYLPVLKKVYFPPWWCPFGDVQTIVSGALRKCPQLPFVREVIEFADGGALGIDWLHPNDCEDDAPIILFLPGITGSTRDCAYILYPAQEICARKWRTVVYNPRGLGGVHLRNKIAYNSVRHHDLAEVIQRISCKYPKAKIIGCGFSMGGFVYDLGCLKCFLAFLMDILFRMVLFNYLATCTAESAILCGALVVSAPYDPSSTTNSLEVAISTTIVCSY